MIKLIQALDNLLSLPPNILRSELNSNVRPVHIDQNSRLKEMSNFSMKTFSISNFTNFLEDYTQLASQSFSISNKTPLLKKFLNSSQTSIPNKQKLISTFNQFSERLILINTINEMKLFIHLLTTFLFNFEEFKLLFRSSPYNEQTAEIKLDKYKNFAFCRENMNKIRISLWNNVMWLLKQLSQLNDFPQMILIYVAVECYKTRLKTNDKELDQVEDYLMRFGYLLTGEGIHFSTQH